MEINGNETTPPLAFGLINNIFSDDPGKYTNINIYLSEIRKRLSPLYPEVKFLSLNSTKEIQNGQMVRFRGAIQNVQPYEIYDFHYLAKLVDGSQTQLTDAFCNVATGNDKAVKKLSNGPYSSRSVYMVMQIPGESEWAAPTQKLSEPTDSLVSDVDKISISIPIEPKLLLIRIYDNGIEEFMPNDIIDFYGIFYHGISDDLDKENNLFDETNAIYKFPNVHVIEHRILRREDLVCRPSILIGNPFEMILETTITLTGCEIAAHYFVSALIAKTYKWQEDLPIPLCTVPTAFLNVCHPSIFIELARLLLPMVQVLPITPQILEQEHLFSRMDHEANMLRNGGLQLCHGTLLILDLTQYTSAAMPTDENFVRDNVTALQRLIDEQKLNIDYGKHVRTHGLEIDIQILALCPGLSTYFLKFPVLVPLPKPFTDGLNPLAELRSRSSDLLQNLRWHLSQSRCRLHQVNLSRDQQMLICESFSGIRKKLNTAATDHFRHLLSLTRIYAALCGQSEMDYSAFQYFLESEYKRLDKLKSLNLV